MNKLQPQSYTIIPPFAAQTLHQFNSTFNSLYPLWTNYPLTLTPFSTFGCSTLTSFYPLWKNYILTLTPFFPLAACLLSFLTPLNKLSSQSYTIFPFWQPSSYLIYPSGKIPLAAQLLIPCAPSEQTTTSFLHHFSTFGSSTLTSIYHLWTNYQPPTSAPLYPLKQLISFITVPTMNQYTLTLTPLYPPWQPRPYIKLFQL